MKKKPAVLFFLVVLLATAACSSVQTAVDGPEATSIYSSPTIIPTSPPTHVSSATPESIFKSPNRALFTSPDGKWIVVGITESSDIRAVTSKDRKIIWEFEYEPEKYGWYEWHYIFYRWSLQSNYVYLTILPQIEGFIPFFRGTGLYQFNLNDGSIVEILSGQQSNLDAFSLSPDEKFLARESYSENTLAVIIRDLVTNTEKKIELSDYNFAGNIIWSPKQDRIVLSVGTGDDWSNLQVFTILVNLKDLSTTELYSDQKKVSIPKEWTSDNEILVESDDHFIYFNLLDKSLKIVPNATPSH